MFPMITRSLETLARRLSGLGSRPSSAVQRIRFPLRRGSRRLRRDHRPVSPCSAISRPVLRRHWLGGMW
jgi:hypothetical protein